MAKKFGIKFEIDIDINDDDDFEDNNNSHTHKVAIRAKIPNSNQNRSIDGSTYDIKFECFDFDENAQMNAIIFPHSNESNKYQEEDKRVEIGEKAEIYFYQFLSKNYPNHTDFKWVSLCSNKYLNSNDGNDQLGYDFKLDDTKGIFGPKQKRYLIEVKGIGYRWSDNIKFHLTENEKVVKENSKYEEYLVVLIENIFNLEITKIASVINWTQNDVIRLEPITYKAWLKPLEISGASFNSSYQHSDNNRSSNQTNSYNNNQRVDNNRSSNQTNNFNNNQRVDNNRSSNQTNNYNNNQRGYNKRSFNQTKSYNNNRRGGASNRNNLSSDDDSWRTRPN